MNSGRARHVQRPGAPQASHWKGETPVTKHLDIELDSQTISDLIYSVTARVTHQLAQIDLRPTPIDQTLDGEPHVVYTTLSGAYQTKLILYAHRGPSSGWPRTCRGSPYPALMIWRNTPKNSSMCCAGKSSGRSSSCLRRAPTSTPQSSSGSVPPLCWTQADR